MYATRKKSEAVGAGWLDASADRQAGMLGSRCRRLQRQGLS